MIEWNNARTSKPPQEERIKLNPPDQSIRVLLWVKIKKTKEGYPGPYRYFFGRYNFILRHWALENILTKEFTVTHWTYINQPDEDE